MEGKLEGKQGVVEEVNYNFKIKLSEYKRVIAVADTSVNGEFYMDGAQYITFEKDALPRQKIATWFFPPAKEEDYASGSDGMSFELGNLKEMKATEEIIERGKRYQQIGRVKYLCLDGNRGYAIVKGSKYYEVDFAYEQGKISNLTCSCYCGYTCKHEVAVMLQLEKNLKLIEEEYAEEFDRECYFAAVNKDVFLEYATTGEKKGKIMIEVE